MGHQFQRSPITESFTPRALLAGEVLEYPLTALGIKQKNGHPGDPQTQGKIERFHQDLK